MDKQSEMIVEVKELPEFVPGMRVEVLTTDNRLIFVGKIQQAKRGMIQVQEASEQRVPYVEFNSEVKLRGFAKKETFSLLGQICGSSQTFWRIDRLRSLQGQERRQFFRQNTNVDVSVMCVNEIFGQGQDAQSQKKGPASCRVLDVSAGGVLIRCEERYAKGDWLFLMGADFIPGEPSFSFTCKVMRVKKETPPYEYGCQFCDLDTKEQDRLIKGILMLQRKELQARRGRRDE